MSRIMAAICREVADDERAVTSLEYGLIGGFILLVIVGSVTLLGQKLIPIFTNVAGGL